MSDQHDLVAPLLDWFRREQRDLPWRRHPDPYRIWVSEMMLQQTRVATAIPYFDRWMQRFPSLDALAAASEDEVLHAWQGLGYYARARNLRRGAQEVRERFGGVVPSRVEDLLSLAGVGRYTAGAIASLAYGVRTPVVDGNVIRVLCRIFGIPGDPAREPVRSRLWQLAEELVPAQAPGDFNAALMELGATLCVPRRPVCHACPVSRWCRALAEGRTEALPELASRPQPTEVRMAAAVIWRDEQVLLVRVPPDADRWAGMWQFPNAELASGESAADGACRAAMEWVALPVTPTQPAHRVKHTVTRYRITLEAIHCIPGPGAPQAVRCPEWAWMALPALAAYALPAAHQRVARTISAMGPVGIGDTWSK